MSLTRIPLTLCAALVLALSACRPTPVRSPSLPEPAPEAQPEATKLEPSTENAGRADPSSVSELKPQPEIVARYLPESLIGKPEKDLAARRVEYNTVLNSRTAGPPRSPAWQYRTTRQGHVVGFEFSNHGGNRILPPRRDAAKNRLFTRDFQFRFDERARQDIHLMVSDWAPSRDRTFRLSEIMNSLMLFFPRIFLPAIVNWQGRNIVTLPTGEEVEFDSESHEIVGGVLTESPVDLHSDRTERKFPGIEYRGKGVMIRANARGTDPRIGTTATIVTGTPPPDCDNKLDCGRCEVAAKELWDQSGAVRFKFATDLEFERFLSSRCGFILPKIGSQLTAAVPAR